MLRKIIKIDEEKCIGCGKCAAACHEGAIDMVNGKAHLARESFCDGLGNCLPACPADAIHFEEREAPAYDEAAVKQAQAAKATPDRLNSFPIQIKLVAENAPFLRGADLLIAADCTAFAYANFHKDLVKNRVVLIGCPKLDSVDYAEKLAEIFSRNDINSVTVVRMEVPCCGGLELAVSRALAASGTRVPRQTVTVGIGGELL